MKQGEIWDSYFDPVEGNEQAGRRPAVIVSGNAVNDNLNAVIVCPISSSIKNYEGNLILEPSSKNGLKQRSEVIIFHIRAVSKRRLRKKLGSISKHDLQSLRAGISDILRY